MPESYQNPAGQTKFESFIRWFFLIVFTCVILFLFFLALTKSTAIDIDEVCRILADNPIKGLAVILIGMAAVCILKEYSLKHPPVCSPEQTRRIMCGILAFVGFCWVTVILLYDLRPWADQAYACRVSMELRLGDYSAFEPGGYLDRYPNNAGMVLVMYYLSFFFGPQCYRIFQLLNVGMMLAGIVLLYKLSGKLFPEASQFSRFLTFLLAAVFTPYQYYTTFVYGTVGGYTLVLLAVHCTYLFWEGRRLRHAVLAALAIAAAVVLKQNYYIEFIALLIFFVIDLLKTKSGKGVLALAVLIAATAASGFMARQVLTHITGMPLDGGVPSSAWIQMGLTSGSDTPLQYKEDALGPGWYDEYNYDIYTENGFDSERTFQAVKEDLRHTADYYAAHPSQLADFLCRKVITMWTAPCFEGPWLQRNTAWFSEGSLYNETNAEFKLFDLFQTFILFGVLACLLINAKTLKLNTLLLPVAFIGGFVFLLFWEAKAQYTVAYFYSLIPFAGAGIDGLACRLRQTRAFGAISRFGARKK